MSETPMAQISGESIHGMTWRHIILALGLHTAEEMAEDGFEAYWLGSTRVIPDKGDLRDYWIKGRKSGARMLRGHFIGCLAAHFGMVSDKGLMGLIVITCEPLMIDIDELVKLNICVRVGDTLAWVALRPGRQQVAAAGALEVTEDAPVFDEGALAVPVLMQAPQPPRVAALTRTKA
nr:hypothetical protein [Tanacetum cinerariifolium]